MSDRDRKWDLKKRKNKRSAIKLNQKPTREGLVFGYFFNQRQRAC